MSRINPPVTLTDETFLRRERGKVRKEGRKEGREEERKKKLPDRIVVEYQGR